MVVLDVGEDCGRVVAAFAVQGVALLYLEFLLHVFHLLLFLVIVLIDWTLRREVKAIIYFGVLIFFLRQSQDHLGLSQVREFIGRDVNYFLHENPLRLRGPHIVVPRRLLL